MLDKIKKGVSKVLENKSLTIFLAVVIVLMLFNVIGL